MSFRPAGLSNRRTLHLGEALEVEDSQQGLDGGRYERVAAGRAFSAIHMASQGYWQRQDDGGASAP